MLMLPAFSRGAEAQQAPQKFTLDGDLALWSVAIRPDRTADFEQILARLKESLQKADTPEAKQQLAGWRVMKGATPMQDGNIIYTHVIRPVPGADYNILQVLYATVTDPAEQQKLFELYRGAFAANLGVSFGTIAADFSQ
jgi:hypothetical protein